MPKNILCITQQKMGHLPILSVALTYLKVWKEKNQHNKRQHFSRFISFLPPSPSFPHLIYVLWGLNFGLLYNKEVNNGSSLGQYLKKKKCPSPPH